MTPSKKIKTVALVIKEASAEALYIGRDIEAWLTAQDIEVHAVLHGGVEEPLHIQPHVDAVVVLGGDGTFVSVARGLMGKNVPLAGVNFGRVGFLTAISPEKWQPDLRAIVSGKAKSRPRMSLAFEHWRDGKILAAGQVVNDVVLTRGMFARLVNLGLKVNDKNLTILRSDGIILATPTGSSGYARSSGGPLLTPTLDAYVAAAICPYSGAFPPMILEAETRFSITAQSSGTSLYLNLDGQEARPFKAGDTVTVYGVPGAFHVYQNSNEDYFSKLRAVGFIRGGSD